MIDVAALRAATPGCGSVVHLNNAGAALQSAATLDTMTSHLKLEAAFGGYEACEMAAGAMDAVRVSAAELIGANAHEIALAHSDSSGFVKAFFGLVLAGWFRSGDVIVVDRLSYNSHHLALLQVGPLLGTEIFVTDDPDAWPERTRLVAYTLVGTHSGEVRDLTGIGVRAGGMGVPFFVDACQAVGQMPVDVDDLACDVLTATGRKWLRGPRGTGFLYVRENWHDRMSPPGIDGASSVWETATSFRPSDGAQRFEEYESSIAARLALGTAIDETLATGVAAIEQRIQSLADRLREGLAGLGCLLHDGEGKRCGIVTFTVPGHGPADVAAAARAAGININNSSAGSARLDMDVRGLVQIVRASPHAYNTDAEIDLLIDVVSGL